MGDWVKLELTFCDLKITRPELSLNSFETSEIWKIFAIHYSLKCNQSPFSIFTAKLRWVSIQPVRFFQKKKYSPTSSGEDTKSIRQEPLLHRWVHDEGHWWMGPWRRALSHIPCLDVRKVKVEIPYQVDKPVKNFGYVFVHIFHGKWKWGSGGDDVLFLQVNNFCRFSLSKVEAFSAFSS